MRHGIRAITMAILVGVSLLLPTPAHAVDGCGREVILGQAQADCIKSGDETNAYIGAHSDHTYSIRPACDIGGLTICSKPAQCHVGDHDGWLYNVYEDDHPDPLDWQACLTKQEAKHLGGLTPGLVEHEFQRLTWPASPIVVQPPQGRTLVNFDTNFFTTNTDPTTQTVTLIGQRVTIEATPTQYTWHFGADTSDADLSTGDPGAPYPDLRVTYRYARVGEVHPSVDTTYAGRFRVGNGAWRTIPSTLTVPGVTVDLQVVSATPHLVGY